MDPGPRVSICIPAFNAAETVERAVRSALDQTYRSVEVIVADDASTDASRELLAAFDDDRLRVVTARENLGRARNLKRALELATGEWLAILPADCWLPKESVETRLDAVIGTSAGLVLGSVELVDEHDHPLGLHHPPGAPGLHVKPDALRVLVGRGRAYPVAALLSRDAYRRVGALVTDVAESHRDWHLFCRLALDGPIVVTRSVVAVERIHPANATHALHASGEVQRAELAILGDLQVRAGADSPEAAILARARARWASRRLSHALLAIAGLEPGDPARSVALALEASPRLSHSPRVWLVRALAACPRSVVKRPLAIALAVPDRMRRRRWKL